MLFKWFKTEVQKDLMSDVAKGLEWAIDVVEKDKSDGWTSAHDNDLKTLKRAYKIIKSRSL
ncbi:hypothetical protein PHIN3_361 [Sinorhizobium phage phiN3]|uniref:Uncharacterized protein n=1 Tax=Sinorhizobium phage phiN3 TaxID=1647405 RepID=A0A0F6WD37_9CAUD|nr:hypothetical protein AVT40_gp172 [Sinorhizobium phage phiN3]AKF13624.1 hypothetical protein PHIN3_361 [Sinorhizobium phage phiN3]